MGLFKKIKKKVKKVAKVAGRATAATFTLGLSETKLLPGVKDLTTSALFPTSIKDLGKGLELVGAGVAASTGNIQPALKLTSEARGKDMGLSNIFSGVQSVLGTASGFGGSFGQAAQLGSAFLSGFLPAQGPTQATFPSAQYPTTMTMAPAVQFGSQAGGALGTLVSSVLAKMSAALGRNISLRAAMIIIRRLSKLLQTPQAIGAAVGLSVSEIMALLAASAVQGSRGRRMNPGNVKALRRAHRRIKSFHKLCGDNDRLRAPRRRSSAARVINVKGGVCN